MPAPVFINPSTRTFPGHGKERFKLPARPPPPMRDFLEITDIDALARVTRGAELVIRADPIIVIPIHGLSFFLDLRKVKEDEVREVFRVIREKMVIVNKVVVSESLSDLISRSVRETPPSKPIQTTIL